MHSHKSNDSTHTPNSWKVTRKPSWEVEAFIMWFPFWENLWKRIDRCSCNAWLALTLLATSCVWQLHGRHPLFQRHHSCKFRFYVLTRMLHHCFMWFHSRSIVIPPLSACYHLLSVWWSKVAYNCYRYGCCAAIWHFEHVVPHSTVCDW